MFERLRTKSPRGNGAYIGVEGLRQRWFNKGGYGNSGQTLGSPNRRAPIRGTNRPPGGIGTRRPGIRPANARWPTQNGTMPGRWPRPPRIPKLPGAVGAIAVVGGALAYAMIGPYRGTVYPEDEVDPYGDLAPVISTNEYDMSGWTRFGGVCAANQDKWTHFTAHAFNCNVSYAPIGTIPAEPNWAAPGTLRINLRYNDTPGTSSLWRKYWNYYERTSPHPRPSKYTKPYGNSGLQPENWPSTRPLPGHWVNAAAAAYAGSFNSNWSNSGYRPPPADPPPNRPQDPEPWPFPVNKPGKPGKNDKERKYKAPGMGAAAAAAMHASTETGEAADCFFWAMHKWRRKPGDYRNPITRAQAVYREFLNMDDGEIGNAVNCLIANQAQDAAIGFAAGQWRAVMQALHRRYGVSSPFGWRAIAAAFRGLNS